MTTTRKVSLSSREPGQDSNEAPSDTRLPIATTASGKVIAGRVTGAFTMPAGRNAYLE